MESVDYAILSVGGSGVASSDWKGKSKKSNAKTGGN